MTASRYRRHQPGGEGTIASGGGRARDLECDPVIYINGAANVPTPGSITVRCARTRYTRHADVGPQARHRPGRMRGVSAILHKPTLIFVACAQLRFCHSLSLVNKAHKSGQPLFLADESSAQRRSSIATKEVAWDGTKARTVSIESSLTSRLNEPPFARELFVQPQWKVFS
jgi:hypothetical protein